MIKGTRKRKKILKKKGERKDIKKMECLLVKCTKKGLEKEGRKCVCTVIKTRQISESIGEQIPCKKISQ
jgi:hypothetical protein